MKWKKTCICNICILCVILKCIEFSHFVNCMREKSPSEGSNAQVWNSGKIPALSTWLDHSENIELMRETHTSRFVQLDIMSAWHCTWPLCNDETMITMFIYIYSDTHQWNNYKNDHMLHDAVPFWEVRQLMVVLFEICWFVLGF